VSIHWWWHTFTTTLCSHTCCSSVCL
jgi:hypothetical protein